MTGHPPYDRSVRRALDEMPDETRAIWRTRYLADEGAEMRALAVLERLEDYLRAKGDEVTIRTVWITLADRAGAGGGPDVWAAAAIAGMALGIGALE